MYVSPQGTDRFQGERVNAALVKSERCAGERMKREGVGNLQKQIPFFFDM